MTQEAPIRLALDEKGNYAPQLAEVPAVENGGISRDGKTYTLKLRPGVASADGKPLTSQDVKLTWKVVNDKDLPIPNRQGWNAVTDVGTPADDTVVFRFAEPNVVFSPTLLGRWILDWRSLSSLVRLVKPLQAVKPLAQTHRHAEVFRRALTADAVPP